MQIRLVIGEQDSRYLDNLVAFLERKHMDEVELFSFTRPEMLLNHVEQNGCDVILLDQDFGLDVSLVKQFGQTACLCSGQSDGDKDGIRLIEKYKKPDLIYKDILDLYAEAGGKSGVKKSRGNHFGQMVLVTGLSGGAGSSTLAAATSRALAAEGGDVLYLNLERTGSSSDFFSGPGNYRFEIVEVVKLF